MAEIDHLVYVVPDLAAAMDRFEHDLGVRPEIGGRHPGMGTWNALVALDPIDGPPCYLELIAADPDQPEPAGPRPFGIDDDDGPRLATFAVRPGGGQSLDDLIGVLRRHGQDPGEAVAMSRSTPGGDLLEWRLTLPSGDGRVPFLIDWGDTPNPATTIGPRLRLARLACTPPAPIRALLDDLCPAGLELGSGDPAPLTAELRSPTGTAQL